MKFDAVTYGLLVRSGCLPDIVANDTDFSSVRPPTRIWIVSKVFSVSNSWNCKIMLLPCGPSNVHLHFDKAPYFCGKFGDSMTSPPDCMWKWHCWGQSSSSEPSPQSSAPSHLNAWLTHFPFEQWIEFDGQAGALHMNGKRLSHVPSSHDWMALWLETATHSPADGSGWLSAQKPEYCDTRAPEADSSVLVLRSSSEAKPSQYLSDVRRLASAVDAMANVALFSAYESTATSSAPYLCSGRKKKRNFHLWFEYLISKARLKKPIVA